MCGFDSVVRICFAIDGIMNCCGEKRFGYMVKRLWCLKLIYEIVDVIFAYVTYGGLYSG